MKKGLSRIISGIKGQDYEIDANISTLDLLEIVYSRFIQMIRGYALVRLRIKGHGAVFCGKNVQIKHGKHIYADKGLIIGNESFIDGLSRDGVKFGHNVTIGRRVSIYCTSVIRSLGIGIEIGNYSAIGEGSIIAGMGGIYRR